MTTETAVREITDQSFDEDTERIGRSVLVLA